MIENNNFTTTNFILSVFLLIAVLFIFSWKLFKLQIIENEVYSRRSMKIIYREDEIPAERGRIYDRTKKKSLADNEDIFNINLDYSIFPDAEKFKIFGLLEKGVKANRLMLLNHYKKNINNKINTTVLIENASFKEIIYISEHREELPGIFFTRGQIRKYNDVGSLSHIIGYLGQISHDEYQMLASKGYNLQSWIGKQGIEKQYDSELKGKNGVRRRTVDFREQTVTEGKVLRKPKRGLDLILTIDSDIQKLAERSLGKRSGSVIVLKPHNGEILAMVSWPWYDNNFITDKNSHTIYQSYQKNPRFPLLNRTIQSHYPPASTFKIIMTTTILDTGALNPNLKIYCPGYKKIGRSKRFHCHKKSGHGSLNLQEGLAQSCNVYFFTAGYDYLGPDADIIAKYCRKFGLGQYTNIDIPGEKNGLVPDKSWMLKERKQRWVGGDTLNMSIGQGNLLVTPLQMANVLALICNRGIIYKPHLMKSLNDSESGKVIRKYEKQILHQPEIKKENLDTVAKYMRGVITKGTARYVISTKAVQSAGKTGTGEVGLEDRWHSWFVCFAPWDAPAEDQYIIVVMVEASNQWEWWSAKAANVILQGIFAKQTYEESIQKLGDWYRAE